MILYSEELQDALTMFGEAVQYVKEQKAARAYNVLTAEDGLFEAALQSDNVTASQKTWLENMRNALLEPFN